MTNVRQFGGLPCGGEPTALALGSGLVWLQRPPGGLAQRDRASAAGAVERSAALAFDAIGDVDSAEELGLDKRGLSRLRLTYSHGGRTESQSR